MRPPRPSQTTFSTLSEDFQERPAAAYPALHQGPPIAWNDEEGAWVIHRYADVAAAMKDPRLVVGEPPQTIRALAKLAGKDVESLALLLEEVLFLRNPPAHEPGRQFLVAVLNEQPLSVHQARLEEIVRRLLDQAPADEEWDAATAYADVAPPLFMAGLLGLSEEDGLAAIGVMNEVTKSFDRARSLRFYERVSKTVETARALIDANIRSRRAAPTADGLSRMIALSDARFGLSDTVIANRVLFLLMAGAETTSALLASTIAAVAERPDVASRVRADPGLAQAAVEETLRFDGPVKQSTRIASCETTIAGQPIKAGDRIVLLVGAAHHDPEAFPDPGRFDIDRSTERLLGFGAGLHFCIGAALARMEARVALNEILRRGELSLRSQGRSWLQHRTLRRLEHLPLTIDRFGEDA